MVSLKDDSKMKVVTSPHWKRTLYFLLFALSFTIFIAILYEEELTHIIKPSPWHEFEEFEFENFNQQEEQEEQEEDILVQAVEKDVVIKPFAVGETEKECDVFEGRWEYDEAARALYGEAECPYIQPKVMCQANGRRDKQYLHWRWKPHWCSLPSFNATFMLEMLRNKRVMFVGDHIHRGQFVSMICLLQSAIPQSFQSFETVKPKSIFRASNYNMTIEFYYSPFLLESNREHRSQRFLREKIIRTGSIDKHARHWRGVDILLLNTYTWWLQPRGKIKILKGSFEGDKRKNKIKEMKTEDAYKLAMNELVKWVEENFDPHKTRVFFTSISPSHELSEEWGGEAKGNCYNETTPILDNPTYWGVGSRKGFMRVIQQVLSKSKVPIEVLNVTQLSEYRKDGHLSIYKKHERELAPRDLANPRSYADCHNWCLPGVQDTWNELLYSKLFFP
ncbi:protein trichome birefringence-like 33 [Ananas comosus]|uniref:Protein trichome birefringence-like 33 n=1 Tax=Ananas comosus TaxID=4615 RepID=A0A6P5G1R3_ANACO|nr:protein trichome birefringence-like 33 [Ananas comosus]